MTRQLVHALFQWGNRTCVEGDVSRMCVLQDAHRHRQAEPARASARRIVVTHPAHHFVVWKVAVSEHDHVCGSAAQRSKHTRIRPPGSRQDMRQQHVQAVDRQAHDVLAGRIVVIAGHERHRRDLPQCGHDVIAADVSRVQDVIDAGEHLKDLRTEKAVGIRDHADSHRTELCYTMSGMSDAEDARANFTYFSNEYAQALQALQAIEDQSSTLMLLGSSEDLRTFIEQFIEMATRVKALAEEKNEPNFAEWFGELLERAEGLRGVIAQR
jgi:hypothetical protein